MANEFEILDLRFYIVKLIPQMNLGVRELQKIVVDC
jgi:hypothetical protein